VSKIWTYSLTPTDPQNLNLDRDHLRTAREAAEALFKPKPPPANAEPSTPPVTPSATDIPAVRKPRVFAIPQAKAPAEEQPKPVSKSRPKPQKTRQSGYPGSEHSRIRVLVEYGMTVEQVAEIYGVPVSVIAPIVQSN
jgi:hypothetical protein